MFAPCQENYIAGRRALSTKKEPAASIGGGSPGAVIRGGRTAGDGRTVKGRAFGSPLARGLYPRASTAEVDPRVKPGAPAADDGAFQKRPENVK
ncbi:MAG: hypothetical protein Q8O91_10265 [Candidatus Aminicenantes bacterium]|nr:hypothetical protein [Candidatus Aminicenantes bacterium]